MSCRIKIRRTEEAVILSLSGRLAGVDAAKLSKKIKTVCDLRLEKVAIDLGDISFIDSYGMGVLLYAWRELQNHNKKALMVNPPQFLIELLRRTNLDRIFTIAESVDSL